MESFEIIFDNPQKYLASPADVIFKQKIHPLSNITVLRGLRGPLHLLRVLANHVSRQIKG